MPHQVTESVFDGTEIVQKTFVQYFDGEGNPTAPYSLGLGLVPEEKAVARAITKSHEFDGVVKFQIGVGFANFQGRPRIVGDIQPRTGRRKLRRM